ncbi:MAG: aminotransferase class V-fold PLP-dependent enzyme [Synechococcaceae cyanobacterium ELA263]
MAEAAAPRHGDLARYLDASATSPPAPEVLAAMAAMAPLAWANPSSLHGPGLAAAELLERSRQRLAIALGAEPGQLIFCSGGSEAIHLALLGSAALLEPGRLLISAVEHPATTAAAAQLQRQGWQLQILPVDRHGLVDPQQLAEWLVPPTRLVSLIWGQSEVGSLQPLAQLGTLCRAAGVRLHVDAVQVVGQQRINLVELPIDLLSCTAHKLQGPRGVGALVLAPGLELAPLIGGGAQEGGRRGGTEAVLLAHGFAEALELAMARLDAAGGQDPLACLRDQLWQRLRQRPGLRLSGPEPGGEAQRLPHHLSLLVSRDDGEPLSGRALVRALARRGWAVSSGSACSSAGASRFDASRFGASSVGVSSAASPILLAMGYSEAEAASGLRLSLGPWLKPVDLEPFPDDLDSACREL